VHYPVISVSFLLIKPGLNDSFLSVPGKINTYEKKDTGYASMREHHNEIEHGKTAIIYGLLCGLH